MDTSLGTPAHVQAKHQARSVTIISFFAALGMFFGYARDAGLAAVFGASSATDAFFVATIIPIMLGRIILSGALAPAVLPVFTGWLEKKREAWRVANTILTLSFFLLILLAIVLVSGARPIVNLISPGLDDARASLAIELLILSAPAVIFFGLSALLGALLNALEVYDMPALGTALVNGVSLAAVLLVARVGGIQSVAASLVVGGLVQFAAQVFALRRTGWRYEFALVWNHPAVREIGRLFAPLLAFMLVDQVVTITERVIGSGFPSGDLSRLTYAGKLYQIPNLIIASSLVVVLFPALSRHAENDRANYVDTLIGGLRNVALLTLPFALWLVWASATWVRLIFQHGEFTAADTIVTSELLKWYGLAVVPTALLLVLTRGFHALRDTMTPLILSLITAGVYVACAIYFAGRFQIGGLPIAFCLAQFFGVALSFIVLSSKIRTLSPLRVGGELLRVALASAPLVGILVIGFAPFEAVLLGANMFVHALVFVVAFGLSVLIYLWLASLLGIAEAKAYLELARVHKLPSRG